MNDPILPLPGLSPAGGKPVKNGIAFWDYLGARLTVPGCRHIFDLARVARRDNRGE